MTWAIEHDVLTRRTSAVIDHGGTYPTPYGAFEEHYSGRVEIDRRTFEQRATARVTLRARPVHRRGRSSPPIWRSWPTRENFTVRIALDATEDGQPVMHRDWVRVYPRDLA